MDLLQGVQDAVQDQRDPEDIDAMAGSGDFKMPSLEQLLDMIGGSNMTEEERKDLMDSILKSQPTRANRGGAEMSLYDQFVFLMIPVAVLVLIFVFFGYKLYKSLVEKERKRDEKRKQKQQKKKK